VVAFHAHAQLVNYSSPYVQENNVAEYQVCNKVIIGLDSDLGAHYIPMLWVELCIPGGGGNGCGSGRGSGLVVQLLQT